MIRLVTAVSLAFSTIYVVWRWGWTLNTDALWFSVPLVLAETYGLLTAFFMAVTAWRLCDRAPAPPLNGRSVDVFVTTYDEPLAIIRKTALAARAIRYPHTTYILDDGRRDEVRRLAEDLGIEYRSRPTNEHAKAGNLNNALRRSSGEFVLQLDADHMPLPQIVDRLIGHFADAQVAFVQSPQDFYNTDAFTYDIDVPGRRLWEDQQLFFRVLQPGKDRLGAAFFVGSCAMVRRKALTEIGGFATRTITEDIETSLILHSKGWKSVFVKESLAFGLAPSTAHAFHVQHLRWGQGAMQTLRHYGPLRLAGLSLAQRIGYFDSLTTYLGGFQRLILYLAPLVFFVTGIFPLNVSFTAFASMFVPYLALQLLSFKLLARGHGSLLLADRFAMAKFFTHLLAVSGYLTRRQLRFRVTPKEAGHVGFRFYAPQLVLAASTFAILAFAGYERVVGLAPDEVPGWGSAAFWVNAAYALWNASVAASIVRVSRGGQHRRLEHRFADALAVNLRILRADGRLARYDVGITENLNPQGAALRSMHPMDAGSKVEMTLPLSTGEVTVRGRLVRRSETPTPYGTVHVHGVEFTGLASDTRNAIELHCAQHATPLERQRYQIGDPEVPAAFRWRNLRRVTRVAVGLPVHVSAESATSAKPIGMGLLENISPAGARMLLDHPVAPGSTLHLEVPGTAYSSRGRVVFVDTLESSVGLRFIVGMAMEEGTMVAPASNWIDAVLAAAARPRAAMRRAQVPIASAGRYILTVLAGRPL
ncbi:MAG: glycosyltransferase, partial [Gemmatimonadaceae bacterium]|nr:glycosyltransferase [Gemmatimonadaceae bacterium]